MADLNLEGAKTLGTPGCKPTAEQLLEDKPLPKAQETPYRAVSARANYLAADRPECQFSAKELCRWMSTPHASGLAGLKRLGRYLEGRRRLVFKYPWQSADLIDTYSDTDWAGCVRTRKSTSGGCLMLGSHLIKSWSTTQSQVALSSGEAEYYGVTRAVGTALGFQSLLRDLGVDLKLRAWTDSSATIGICGRTGLGRLRHIDTQCLWLQAQVRSGAVELRKVKGTENPADLFTKHLTSAPCVEALLGLFNCWYRDGRAKAAPCLRPGAGSQAGAKIDVAAVAFERGQADDRMVTELMSIGENAYPMVTVDGEEVPEAWSYDQKSLPHLQQDLERLFPKAYAAKEAGDRDPPERTLMGEAWADMEEFKNEDWLEVIGVEGALVVPPDEVPTETPGYVVEINMMRADYGVESKDKVVRTPAMSGLCATDETDKTVRTPAMSGLCAVEETEGETDKTVRTLAMSGLCAVDKARENKEDDAEYGDDMKNSDYNMDTECMNELGLYLPLLDPFAPFLGQYAYDLETGGDNIIGMVVGDNTMIKANDDLGYEDFMLGPFIYDVESEAFPPDSVIHDVESEAFPPDSVVPELNPVVYGYETSEGELGELVERDRKACDQHASCDKLSHAYGDSSKAVKSARISHVSCGRISHASYDKSKRVVLARISHASCGRISHASCDSLNAVNSHVCQDMLESKLSECETESIVFLCLNTKSSPNRVTNELLQASVRPLPLVGPEGESKTVMFSARLSTLRSRDRFGLSRNARLSVSAFRVSLSRLPPHCCLGSTLSGQTETADRRNCLTPFNTVNGLNCILIPFSNRCCISRHILYREARCGAGWHRATSAVRAGAICMCL